MRIFSTCERAHILHVTPEGREGGPFECISVRRAFEQNVPCKFLIRAWNKCLRDLLGRPNWSPKYLSTMLKPATANFAPDLVLGVIYTTDGLRLMETVLKAVQGKPAVLWFHDLQLAADKHGRVRQLERLLSLVTEVWTLSPPMTEWLKGVVGRWPVQLAISSHPHWCVPASNCYQRVHRTFSHNFRCVMLGNVWDSEMIPIVKKLWRECHGKLSGLAPVQWICHEAGMRRITNLGIELGPEIEWAGEVSEGRLHETIREADLAIIPVSINMGSDYARFSVPSKIGELAATGVPMVIISGSTTATARYATEFLVGELLTELGRDRWSARLCEIISSARERARLSALAHNYAERYLNEDQFRSRIFVELRRVAFEAARIPPPQLSD